MSKVKANKVLVTAFRALTAKQRANLKWHLDRKTRILCGLAAGDWIADGGAG